MNILILITARGGSKRLPGKNIKPLHGEPLINWTIRTAKKLTALSVLVSTDDPQIAEVAKAAGAQVPWLRPSEFASDKASSCDVALHALDWFESQNQKVDGLLLLQPTTPYRSLSTLQRGLELFNKSDVPAVIGMGPANSHPHHCFMVKDDKLEPFVSQAKIDTRTQDLPDAYAVNGAFYLIRPESLRKTKSFMPPGTIPLIMTDPRESIDIDTELDWKMAESILTAHDLA